jgi:hypothetical protein
MRELTLPLPESVAIEAGRANRVTHFILADSLSEMADCVLARAKESGGASAWSGGLTNAETARTMRGGDLSRVGPSDALLARFERFAFATPTKAWRRDVAGAVPNVPAFLAGHPQTMRRRVRLTSAGAPLAVIVDLTTSQGINARDIEKRGAAILALVRILSARRPVELWAGAFTGADGDRNGCAMFARIDTAPLDLARAAFAMVSPAYPRRALYALARTKGFSGGWPYGSGDASRRFLESILKPAFPAMGDVLAIPAAHESDAIHRDPVAWIEGTLAALDPAAAA